MKKNLFLYILMFFIALPLFAQKDVTTFLGISVDGFKPEMKKKLIAKGFIPKVIDGNEFFEGEFNGTDVNVYIATNNNKVCRIMLSDKNKIGEADVKIRFNNLVNQFENNKRYLSFREQKIADDVNISYEMIVNKKRFQASYYQTPDVDKLDTLSMKNAIYEDLLRSYSQEELDNPTEEISKVIVEKMTNYASELLLKKSVWFMISEHYGKYYITMYYDNEYNRAQGEDL